MILIRDGKLTSEILLAFMLYQGQLQNETMNLFNSYSSLIKSSGAGDKVFRLLDRLTPPPGTGSPDVLALSASPPQLQLENDQATRPAQTRSGVKLKDIKFVYPTRPTHPVLKGLNLNIPSGSTTALVGSSGCGKSTIVSLLKRFYDPTAGTILIDNKDLRSMDIKEHRRHVGVVTQDPVLFSGSIFSNITYGCQGASMEDAMNAAKLANAHGFVTSFPDGYNTEVGERGIALSGGQKQRIAIARAIAKNPSLLLLDEATSALDAESETVVQAALDRLLKDATNRDMTTVVVAHRLRTVRNADCIAYIHDGKVAEQGTHDELMKKRNGFYRRMVDQAGDDGLLPA
jgi:ABC-type multidrug transport system fused ATPase/permease subunit